MGEFVKLIDVNDLEVVIESIFLFSTELFPPLQRKFLPQKLLGFENHIPDEWHDLGNGQLPIFHPGQRVPSWLSWDEILISTLNSLDLNFSFRRSLDFFEHSFRVDLAVLALDE